MKTVLGLWAVLLLLPLANGAQQHPVPQARHYAFQQVGADLGLSTLEVMSIVQDRDGFFWFGTSEGVLRYDGSSIARFGADDGLPATWISDLALSSDGAVWAAADNGVAHFDGRRFVPLVLRGFTIDSSTSRQKMAFDRHGGLYLATDAGLVFVPGGEASNFRVWSTGQGVPQPAIEAVHCDSDGSVWFASGHQLGRLDPVTGRLEMLAAGLPDELVLAILRDSQGRLWVRTPAHLGYLDHGKFVANNRGIPKANTYGKPSLDLAGNLLVPTGEGLVRWRNGGWDRVSRQQGMSDNSVLAAAEALDGSYWIGHEGQGVERWPDPNEWSAWTQAEGLPDSSVWAIVRDHRRRLWVGTANGLAMWDPAGNRWHLWNEHNGLTGPRVQGLRVAANGDILAWCYPSGMVVFSASTLKPVRIATPSGIPRDVLVRPDGAIWIGSASALQSLVFENGCYGFHDIPVPPEVAGTTQRFAAAPGGVVWAGGPKGLSRFDGAKWTYLSTAGDKPSRAVQDVAAVSANEVAFIDDQLLEVQSLRLTEGKPVIKHLDRNSGLSPGTRYYVQADREGRIWAGGPHGLTRFDPGGAIRRFTQSDGLIWNDVNERAFLEDEDGTILFGTSRGLARYAPKDKVDSPLPPRRVVITSVLLGNRESAGNRRPEVDYAANSLRVQFSFPSYRGQALVVCRYRLNGLEADFTDSALREASYRSLPAGSYRFEVKCRNSDGTWSAPAQYSFIVRPAWWASWLFLGFIVITAPLLMWTIVRLRTRSLQRARRRLEKAVAEHSAELARANQELATANLELKEASVTDPLTGLHNRRYFYMVIEANVAQSVREYANRPVSTGPQDRLPGINSDIIFYIIDIDQFKSVNDTYGHAAGDQLLVEAARRIQAAIRKPDILVRWGGEEFLVASSSTQRNQGDLLAARIMERFSGTPFCLANSRTIQRTCSVGWAPFPWSATRPDAIAYEEVLTIADRALYAAKSAGRNCAFGFLPAFPASQLAEPGTEPVELALPTGGSIGVQAIQTPGPVQEPELAAKQELAAASLHSTEVVQD